MSAATAFRVDDFGFYTSFKEVQRLCDTWSKRLSRGDLPAFEDVAIGSLGPVVDNTLILRPCGTDFDLLRPGSAVRRKLGIEAEPLCLSALQPNFRTAMGSAAQNALRTRRPVLTTTHALIGRSVTTCEFLAMPLRSRWGEDLVFGFLRQRPTAYDLVDAIYMATDEGLLALAAVPAVSGALDFQVVSLNAGAARLLGRLESDLCWAMLSSAFTSEDFGALASLLDGAARSGAARHGEFTFHRPDGDVVHVRVSTAPMGDLLGVALTDVTMIRRREESTRLLFAQNPMPMLVYDPDDGRLIEANDAFVNRYGYDRPSLMTMTVADLYPPDHRVDTATHERQRHEAGEGGKERLHLTAAGALREVLVYARDLPFEGRSCVIASIVDVTEQRQAEARIKYIAHHDAITGLANRVKFKASLDARLAARSTNDSLLAIHCIDLDSFKQVNDTFGHPTGDALLALVADRLRSVVRGTDLIARLGGDEFAIVQSGLAHAAEAGQLARRLIDLLGQPFEIEGQQIAIGASIGISLAPTDGLSTDHLLKNADIALYRAKGDGRGTYAFFEAAMQHHIQRRRALEIDLRMALVAGEFSLKFQPLVEIASSRIVGCEALLRWHHPRRGAVPPTDFIPLAEETGLIVTIGEWVMRQACIEAATWPPELTVAVNLSPIQFKARGLVASVASALAASGLPASRLELEITESVLLVDSDANIATLQQLRAMGVKISMDDFGTGYSSLSYLRAFPFDKIKIDKSFIADLESNEDCRAIVRAVVSLGASLGIKTLAEGVETKEQLARLSQEGCGEVQGYLFSPPATPEELERLLGLQETREARDLAA